MKNFKQFISEAKVSKIQLPKAGPPLDLLSAMGMFDKYFASLLLKTDLSNNINVSVRGRDTNITLDEILDFLKARVNPDTVKYVDQSTYSKFIMPPSKFYIPIGLSKKVFADIQRKFKKGFNHLHPDEWKIIKYLPIDLPEFTTKQIPEIEDLIIRHPDTNYLIKYVKDSGRGRWKKLEDKILRVNNTWNTSFDITKYAKQIIHGRWPEGEERLLQALNYNATKFQFNNGWYFEYINDVIKGRWIELEDLIKDDKERWQKYIDKVIRVQGIDTTNIEKDPNLTDIIASIL